MKNGTNIWALNIMLVKEGDVLQAGAQIAGNLIYKPLLSFKCLEAWASGIN